MPKMKYAPPPSTKAYVVSPRPQARAVVFLVAVYFSSYWSQGVERISSLAWPLTTCKRRWKEWLLRDSIQLFSIFYLFLLLIASSGNPRPSFSCVHVCHLLSFCFSCWYYCCFSMLIYCIYFYTTPSNPLFISHSLTRSLYSFFRRHRALRIPHESFWLGLPGLISDGAVFAFSCGRSRPYSRF